MQITEIPQFLPYGVPKSTGSTKCFLLYQKGQIFLLNQSETPDFVLDDIPDLLKDWAELVEFMGELSGKNCFAVQIRPDAPEIPEGDFKPIRSLFQSISYEWLMLAGYGAHLLYWADLHQFCGRCGHKSRSRETERAKVCDHCDSIYYPSIAPAVIVAVTKGDQLLLAQPNRPNARFYSVLAGFVEIGETFEQTVSREIKEEAGIEVKNIQYFGSQPWPFPNSLMIGFTAEWASGEIEIDREELVEAGWYRAGEMPTVPGSYSIAGRLIEWFLKQAQNPPS
jgi:NAD+ diphosphatase